MVNRRYPGGFLTTSSTYPQISISNTTPGIWSLSSQFQANANNNWPRTDAIPIEYLVVAGGGGGLSGGGQSGGGAGGLLTGNFQITPGTTLTVTVGGGGAAGVNGVVAANGGNSSIVASRGSTSILAYGGGGGAGDPAEARDGGSGGGIGDDNNYAANTDLARGIYPGSTYISAARQGYDGGYGLNFAYGPGGGGAGGPGQNGPFNNIGAGGIGVTSNITGISTTYATGGFGDSDLSGSKTDEAPNTGNGGDGSGLRNGQTVAGAGGSGIVVISYPDSHPNPSSISNGFLCNVSYSWNFSEINSSPGLAGKFFNGSWRATLSTGNVGTIPLTSVNDSSNVTGFSGLPTPAHRNGVNTWTNINYTTVGDNYGFIAIGYFGPPTTGTYTFFTASDDYSGVWVGNIASSVGGRTSANAVVNNGLGLTAGQGNTKVSGTIALTANVWYPIRIVHESTTGTDNLIFSWSGPGISETTDLTTYFRTPAPTTPGVKTYRFTTSGNISW